MKVLVAGARGMVGRAVAGHCLTLGDQAFPLDHQTSEVANDSSVRECLESKRPEVYHVVNRGEGASYHEFTVAALPAASAKF